MKNKALSESKKNQNQKPVAPVEVAELKMLRKQAAACAGYSCDANCEGRCKACPADVISDLLTLCERQATATGQDTRRLDYLQSRTMGHGGWMVWESRSNRGMRCAETSQPGHKPTVREAIDAAINSAAK